MTDAHYGREIYKKRMIEAMDTILMDVVGKSDFDDFEDYQNDMENFTSKKILRGDFH